MTEKKEKKLTNPWADTEVDKVEETEENQDSNLFDVNFDQLVDQLGAEMPKEDEEDTEEEDTEEEKTEEESETKTEDENAQNEQNEQKEAKTEDENAQNAQNEQKEAKTEDENAQNAQNEQNNFAENTKGLTDSLSVDPTDFFNGLDKEDKADQSSHSQSKIFDPTANRRSKIFAPAGQTSQGRGRSKIFDPSAKKEAVKETPKETLPVNEDKPTNVLDFDPLEEVKNTLGEDKFDKIKRDLSDDELLGLVKTSLDSYLASVEEAKKKALKTFKSDASLNLVNAHLAALKKEQEEVEAWKAEINK